jgi:hypothetical protein
LKLKKLGHTFFYPGQIDPATVVQCVIYTLTLAPAKQKEGKTNCQLNPIKKNQIH